MSLANAKKTRANKTFIVQPSLMIVTYDHQNMSTVQATDDVTKLLGKNH
jgi:hypothetical protein